MSYFSSRPEMVRVDFFKESGKWYATEEMRWLAYEGEIHATFLRSLKFAFVRDGVPRYAGMTAVCLHPYHQHEHPLMRHNWSVE